MKRILILLSSLALFTLSGCNSSVDARCEDLAISQCEKCNSCASGDAARKAVFCDLQPNEDCVDKLTESCSDGASILPDPKEDLDQCEEDLQSLQCSLFYRSEAQGRETTVDACRVFF